MYAQCFTPRGARLAGLGRVAGAAALVLAGVALAPTGAKAQQAVAPAQDSTARSKEVCQAMQQLAQQMVGQITVVSATGNPTIKIDSLATALVKDSIRGGVPASAFVIQAAPTAVFVATSDTTAVSKSAPVAVVLGNGKTQGAQIQLQVVSSQDCSVGGPKKP